MKASETFNMNLLILPLPQKVTSYSTAHSPDQKIHILTLFRFLKHNSNQSLKSHFKESFTILPRNQMHLYHPS